MKSPIFSVKMALCKLWNAEVASETPFLSLSINHSLSVFGHYHLKPVQSMQCKHFTKNKTYSLLIVNC